MSGPTPGTVYVLDDEPTVVRALTRLLRGAGFEVHGFHSSDAFLQRFQRAQPPAASGCVLIDLVMPGRDGLAVQRALSELNDPPPCVFLSGRGDIEASVRAMKAGALDFLTKPVDRAALLTAVAAALQRDDRARALRLRQVELRARYARLTRRERQVFAGVVAGHLNKQIAVQLGTVEKTVKVHRGRMMEKMGAASVAELVRMSVLLS